MNKKDWPVFTPSGAQLISDERLRQVADEGWTAEHDDQHTYDELARAAVCYAMPERDRQYDTLDIAPENWPWDPEWWKPTPDDRIRELMKAGALIAAEIDRLLRAKPSTVETNAYSMGKKPCAHPFADEDGEHVWCWSDYGAWMCQRCGAIKRDTVGPEEEGP